MLLTEGEIVAKQQQQQQSNTVKRALTRTDFRGISHTALTDLPILLGSDRCTLSRRIRGCCSRRDLDWQPATEQLIALIQETQHQQCREIRLVELQRKGMNYVPMKRGKAAYQTRSTCNTTLIFELGA